MKVHFVCTSNTFRSRMAASYLASKEIPEMKVTSSGIAAAKNPNGIISWFAQRIIEHNKLAKFEPPIWTQATKNIFDNQDLVIFMQKWHFDHAVSLFGYDGKNYEIWDIEDLDGNDTEDVRIKRSEEIYQKIVKNIDSLISRLL